MPHISTNSPAGQADEAAYHKVARRAKSGVDGRELPVVAVAVFKTDVVVMRKGESHPVPFGVRGAITKMSDESLRRLAFVANNTNTDLRSMITLTYPNEFPADGRIVKGHLNSMLTALRRELGEHLSYLWFLEFQKRGAPHVHILLSVSVVDLGADRLRQWLSWRWYKIVKSGDELHLLAGTQWEDTRKENGLRRYVVKYAAKTYQKEVPPGFENVGRFWGNSRNLKVFPVLMQVADEDVVREHLEDWPYNQVLNNAIPRVLYNAADWWATSA